MTPQAAFAPVQPLTSTAQALTLAERLAIVRRHGHLLAAGDFDLPLGQGWVDKLEAMPPFDQFPHLWERFLAAHQVTEEELCRALGAPGEFLAAHAGDAGRWAEDLEEALAESRGEVRFPWPASLGTQGKLLTFSQPVIAWALKRIRRGLESFEAASGLSLLQTDVAGVGSPFLPPLAGAAYRITHRTLVLELNVCRLRGELQGETPDERFESFVARLADPAYARTLYEEYAVLSRELVEGLRAIADFCLLFLRHFAEDQDVLRETFLGGEAPGPITKLTMSGDGHRGGRRVSIVELAGGRKLLYKPHSLRVDEHFQELLRWLDGAGHQPPFRTMVCLDRGDHGWTEFIPGADCTTEAEIERFYLRQGALLALLYAMLATDFHHENLLASGEHPVLIDLESLFHPTLRPADEDQLDEEVRGAMVYSVLRTSLLPSVQSVGPGEVFDIGGLSDVEGQQSPYASPYLDMSVADQAHVDRMRMRVSGSHNLPTLRGVRPDPAAYTEQVVEGFTAMYRLLLKNREALLAPDGPIHRFAGDEIRFIFRNTRTYVLLSNETLHPDLQRNALERDRHFLRLWYALEERRDAAGLVPSELDSLWRGDVPFFSTRTDSVDIFDHRDERHPSLLARSCLAEVVDHIRRLHEGDLKRQVWFIRGAIACQRILPGHLSAGGMGNSFREVSAGAAQAELLSEACRVGDRLLELSLTGRSDEGEGATWLGMVLINENVWRLLPLGIDLYNGLGGIALFLAHLGRASGEKKYSDLARSVVTVVRRQQRSFAADLAMTGGFTGWGGLAYVYTHLHTLWGDSQLLDEALQCARSAGTHSGKDENFEVMYGNAGAIIALHGLYQIHPDPEVLESMRLCGQHLLAKATPMAEGLGWSCKIMSCLPLAGYSHGVSGIACALDLLFRVTGEEEYLRAAASALAYERTLFSLEHGNWKDMRGHRLDLKEGDPPPPVNYPVAWCNGAPGIGLSRFRMPSLGGAGTRADVEVALATTRRLGFGYTHSLCHGDLGNLELFLEARHAGWPPLEEGEVERYAAGILEGIRQQGWICGTPRGLETPGLMTGLAGIGYGFLRLYDPEGTPSVLLLDPPRSASR